MQLKRKAEQTSIDEDGHIERGRGTDIEAKR